MMTAEEIEDLIDEQKHVSDCLGMVDYEHFLAFKSMAANGLILFGNNFMLNLGSALKLASTKDAVKIIRVWRNECTQHEMLYKMHLARKRAAEIDGAV